MDMPLLDSEVCVILKMSLPDLFKLEREGRFNKSLSHMDRPSGKVAHATIFDLVSFQLSTDLRQFASLSFQASSIAEQCADAVATIYEETEPSSLNIWFGVPVVSHLRDILAMDPEIDCPCSSPEGLPMSLGGPDFHLFLADATIRSWNMCLSRTANVCSEITYERFHIPYMVPKRPAPDLILEPAD